MEGLTNPIKVNILKSFNQAVQQILSVVNERQPFITLTTGGKGENTYYYIIDLRSKYKEADDFLFDRYKESIYSTLLSTLTTNLQAIWPLFPYQIESAISDINLIPKNAMEFYSPEFIFHLVSNLTHRICQENPSMSSIPKAGPKIGTDRSPGDFRSNEWAYILIFLLIVVVLFLVVHE